MFFQKITLTSPYEVRAPYNILVLLILWNKLCVESQFPVEFFIIQFEIH